METTKYFATLFHLTGNWISVQENFDEKRKKEEYTGAERNVTLHILLQIDFVCGGGSWQIWCWVNWSLAAFAVAVRPGWFVLRCSPGRAGTRLWRKGCCFAAACGPADAEGHCTVGRSQGFGWALRVPALPHFRLGPTAAFALRFCFPVGTCRSPLTQWRKRAESSSLDSRRRR